MQIHKGLLYILMMLWVQIGTASEQIQKLGNINFPNSGANAAQKDFIAGVKALHSFQFDEARFAFERAQKIDPNFALAYWGQAMSDNHPLWAQQDTKAATQVLMKLAPTFEERLAASPSEKEKAFLSAVEILYYSSDDKLQRDTGYSEYMADMHKRWPEDDEISIFYALSILGTVRRSDKGFRRQALAAAISQSVFLRNKKHPGAAHFIIHSFDDPDHAILALPAARVYAGIAPAAAHALHMPSHIFVQLGRWQDVVNSNIEAYAAAVAVNEKYGLQSGREDFHTLSWLLYANLMLGNFVQAEENLDTAQETVAANPTVAHIEQGYLKMRAMYVLETQAWGNYELANADTVEGQHANWVSVVGMNAAHQGDNGLAQEAIRRLIILGESASTAGKNYLAKQIAILQKETLAVVSLQAGDYAQAISYAGEAAEMEIRDLRAPSGPPDPVKPAVELYADVLLAADRPLDALAAYDRSLQRIPMRTPSISGLARAASQTGDDAKTEAMMVQLKSIPGINNSRTSLNGGN